MAVLIPGKFLYLANVRVASRSTAQALRPLSRYSDVRATERHHCGLEEAKLLCAYGGELVVSTIRNPWDLMVSFFFLRAAGEGLSFEQFLSRRSERPKLDIWPHYANSQRVWRYETLVEDARKTCVEFDVMPLDLPRVGVSEGREPYRNYYTPATRELIADWFAPEIEAEGYDY